MMTKSHLILILALVALTANTVRMTARVQELSKQSARNVAYARYLKACWNAEDQSNLSTDMCVESKFWEE